ADQLGAVGARAHAAEVEQLQILLAVEAAKDADGIAHDREVRRRRQFRPRASHAGRCVEQQQIETFFEGERDRYLQLGRAGDEAEQLSGYAPEVKRLEVIGTQMDVAGRRRIERGGVIDDKLKPWSPPWQRRAPNVAGAGLREGLAERDLQLRCN